MVNLLTSIPGEAAEEPLRPERTLRRRLDRWLHAKAAQAAVAMVRVAAGLLLAGAGVSTLMYHNAYQTIPPMDAGAERVVWVPQGGLLPESFYGAVALGLGFLFIVGWLRRYSLVLGGLLVCLVSIEHLHVSPFYNLSMHLLPLLVLVGLALAVSPEGDPFSLDALLPVGPPALSRSWSNSWLVLCLRLFLGGIFLFQGYQSLVGLGLVAFAQKLYVIPFASTGIPPVLLWVAGLTNPPLQFLGGLALTLGLFTRTAAVAVGLFLLEIIFGHMIANPLEYEGDLQKYGLANFLVLAAILFLVDRGNHLSLDTLLWRRAGAGRLAKPIGAGLLLGLFVVLPWTGTRAQTPPTAPVAPAKTEEAAAALREGNRLTATRTLDDAWRAVEAYQRALLLDPRCAPAYVALAEAYIRPPISYSGPGRRMSSAEAYPQARALARQALEIDEGLGSAHRLLGELAFYETYDWAVADAEFRRAVELEPGSAEAHNDFARYLASSNRFDQAHAEAAQAFRLAPHDAGMAYLAGQILYFQRRFREAVALDRRLLAEFPDAAIGHFLLGSALVEDGEPAEGVAELERFAELTKRNPGGLGALAHAQARAGHPEIARQLLAELLARERIETLAFYQVAAAYMALGESDHALDWLERTVREERGNWPTWLRQDARFDMVRTTPRFQRLLAQLWPPS